MNIFISYGHDVHIELVRRIKRDLEANGHKVWLDEERIMVHHDWEIAIVSFMGNLKNLGMPYQYRFTPL